jgi:hypothetical protein
MQGYFPSGLFNLVLEIVAISIVQKERKNSKRRNKTFIFKGS